MWQIQDDVQRGYANASRRAGDRDSSTHPAISIKPGCNEPYLALALKLLYDWATAKSRITFSSVTRFRERFVAVLLLAWLPLQAPALPALALLCEQEQTSAAKHEVLVAAHGHHDGAGHHQHVDDEGGAAMHDHGNGCCHHLFSAVLPVSLDAPRESGSPLDLIPLFSLSSFFPEQPQRPPLA